MSNIKYKRINAELVRTISEIILKETTDEYGNKIEQIIEEIHEKDQ